MACQRCNSERTAEVGGKCSDLCGVSIGDYSHDGYVPRDMGIGGGDYISFDYCLDCGQIQGTFPLGKCQLETDRDEKMESLKDSESFDEEEFFK